MFLIRNKKRILLILLMVLSIFPLEYLKYESFFVIKALSYLILADLVFLDINSLSFNYSNLTVFPLSFAEKCLFLFKKHLLGSRIWSFSIFICFASIIGGVGMKIILIIILFYIIISLYYFLFFEKIRRSSTRLILVLYYMFYLLIYSILNSFGGNIVDLFFLKEASELENINIKVISLISGNLFVLILFILTIISTFVTYTLLKKVVLIEPIVDQDKLRAYTQSKNL